MTPAFTFVETPLTVQDHRYMQRLMAQASTRVPDLDAMLGLVTGRTSLSEAQLMALPMNDFVVLFSQVLDRVKEVWEADALSLTTRQALAALSPRSRSVWEGILDAPEEGTDA